MLASCSLLTLETVEAHHSPVATAAAAEQSNRLMIMIMIGRLPRTPLYLVQLPRGLFPIWLDHESEPFVDYTPVAREKPEKLWAVRGGPAQTWICRLTSSFLPWIQIKRRTYSHADGHTIAAAVAQNRPANDTLHWHCWHGSNLDEVLSNWSPWAYCAAGNEDSSGKNSA